MIDRPVVVLGATGSIGRSTLEVARRLGATVGVLAARTPRPELVELARSHPEATVVVAGGSRDERRAFADAVPGDVRFGPEAVIEAAALPGSIVVNGLVGAVGLRPTMAAARAGNRLALANKESIVAGGPLVMAAVAEAGAELIPVDSEHSALFQLLSGVDRAEVASLVLTASGGPFRGWTVEQLEEVTPSQALRHPTWEMGRRITVDSATLVNKGLEVIEAHVLFGVPFERVEVVVHPQSLVHGFVSLTDGSLLAHIGATDMRIPIQYALTHPQRTQTGIPFDLSGQTLAFEPVDRRAFRSLDLAYAAGRAGGVAPCVFNAADEVAVEAFLTGRLGFGGIPEVIERTLESVGSEPLESVDHVLAADAEARSTAASLLGGYC